MVSVYKLFCHILCGHHVYNTSHRPSPPLSPVNIKKFILWDDLHWHKSWQYKAEGNKWLNGCANIVQKAWGMGNGRSIAGMTCSLEDGSDFNKWWGYSHWWKDLAPRQKDGAEESATRDWLVTQNNLQGRGRWVRHDDLRSIKEK